MNRVVTRVRKGRAAGRWLASVEVNGSSLSIKTFDDELDASIYLEMLSDDYLQNLMEKRKKNVKYDVASWSKISKAQISLLSIKYMFMKSNLSAIEQKAIKRFSDENNCVPQMSVFPTIRFKVRGTDTIIEKSLMVLVFEHKTANEEESKTRGDEKKRIERENKWKPQIGRS